MGASQYLRSLDRRVLQEDKRNTPEAWRKAYSRWPVLLGGAVFYGVIAVIVHATLDKTFSRAVVMAVFLMMMIFFGFNVGQMKAEADRLNGRDPLAKRRPRGL